MNPNEELQQMLDSREYEQPCAHVHLCPECEHEFMCKCCAFSEGFGMMKLCPPCRNKIEVECKFESLRRTA